MLQIARKRIFAACDEGDLEAMRKSSYAKNTNYATTSSDNMLQAFYNSLPKNSETSSYQELSSEAMKTLLEKFCICCRTVKGEEYKSFSLLTMRQNLSLSIKLSHQFDIIADTAFSSSGRVVTNVQTEASERKRKGQCGAPICYY